MADSESQEKTAYLAMKIEDKIRDAYLLRNYVIFYPQAFVEDGLGTLQDVLLAFVELRNLQKIKLEGTLRCSEGHDFFTSDFEDAVTRRARKHCSYCLDHESEPEDNRLFARAVITAAWRRVLDERAFSQKKTLMRAT